MNVQLPKVQWERYALILVGAVVLLQFFRSGKQPDKREASAFVAAAHVQYARLHVAFDSVKKEGATARIVYVTKRRSALDAVAHLPPAQLHGDSLTLPDGTFVVPHPVAEYVAGLREVVRRDSLTILAADSALAATVREVVASERVTAAADTVAEAEKARADIRPGFLSRAWDAVRVPVIAVGSGLLGYTIHAVLH